jgi:hypothetical protein
MNGELMWIIGIGFIVSLACAWWVNDHAKRMGKDPGDQALWTLIAFLFPILGVLLYIVVGLKPTQENHDAQYHEPYLTETKTCGFCGRNLASDARWCDACGKALE